MENLINRLQVEDLLTTGVELATRWGLKIIMALIVVLIGRWIAGRMRLVARKAMERAKIDPMLSPFLATLAFWGVMTFVLISALGIVGIPVTSFVAVLGAAGLAIGLAFRDTLSNFAAGAMLLSFRPFDVDDFIQAADTDGTVESVGIFSTVLRRPDNSIATVPNSKIWATTIVNVTARDQRRIDLTVGVSYDDDLGQAVEIARRILGEEQRVLAEPAPVVEVHELGDSSVNLVVRPWCATKEYWPVRWALTRALKEQLEAGGCSIPFPQRDVHVFSSAQDSKASAA